MKTVKLPKTRRTRVTRTEAVFGPRRILVPVDFSELSEVAVGRAVALARQFGSEVILLHAVEPVIQPFEAIIVPPEMEEVNLTQLARAKETVDRIRKELVGKGINCRSIVKVGKPWSVIVENAEKQRVDLIVLPTHGRTWFKHVVLGSTAERVVQHATCSVLVVR